MKVFILTTWITANTMKGCIRKSRDEEEHYFEDIAFATAGEYEESVARRMDTFDIGIVDPPLFYPYVNCVKNVRWISSTYSGVDDIIHQVVAGKPPCFQLTRLGGVFRQDMPEYVIAQMIAHERKFHDAYLAQAAAFWDENIRLRYRLLNTLTIGILGVGDLGRHVAKFCKFFGMSVHGLVRKIPSEKDQFIDRYFTSDELPMLLRSVDYVCNILPATPETDSLLSATMLENCRERKAVLINVGRGNICTEKDLITALDAGSISHAILDVFPVEPLPTESQLWKHPRVTCTPHNSCLPSQSSVADLFLQNLNRFTSGLPLNFEVLL